MAEKAGYADGRPRTMNTWDTMVVASNEYDVASSRLLSSYQFTRGAQELRVTAIHHVYTSAHLGHLLTEAGFTDLTRYGGPDGEPFEVRTGRLLLTARRE